VVPRGDWTESVSDCRYLVADGDRAHHDLAAARSDCHQAGSATRPIPGVVPEIVTLDGQPVPDGGGGYLIIKKPWPGMLRTIYGDPDRYVRQYWSQIPGTYFTGDGARRDSDGYYWIMGRVDDVINVSGHRLSTMEVESALVAHEVVAEAAVVGRADDIKGQSIWRVRDVRKREGLRRRS